MSAGWYVFTDDEAGPFTLQQVAEQVARGDVRESDLARRKDARTWQKIEQVPDIMRAVRQLRAPRRNALPAAPQRTFDWTRLLQVACCLTVAAALWQLLRSSTLPEAFPEQTSEILTEAPTRVDQLRPRPPVNPTFPGMARGVRVAVPGFDSVHWMKSPTLSHNLLTIVYVHYRDEASADDLVVAKRADVNSPFSAHRVLTTVNSNGRETHPALSPDGRELLFTREGKTKGLWRSRWDSKTNDFSAPEQVVILGESMKGLHVENAQFVSENLIKIAVGDENFTQRRQLVCSRPNPTEQFTVDRPLPIANPWPRYFFSSRTERGYFPAEDGLWLTAYQLQHQQFVIPDRLLTNEQLGGNISQFDDAVWVSPQEDLIFYCAPPAEPAQDRRLWMIRP